MDGLEGQELSHALTHSINHERWWHSGYDCSGDVVRGADDDLRWVLPAPGTRCVYKRMESESGNGKQWTTFITPVILCEIETKDEICHL